MNRWEFSAGILKSTFCCLQFQVQEKYYSIWEDELEDKGYLGSQPQQSCESAAKGACMVFLECSCCVLF